MTSAEQHAQETKNAVTGVYMHLWPLATRSNGSGGESDMELELIASHTSNPNHLDPSCPACGRLRVYLQSIARIVVERAATLTSSAAPIFEIYADAASIVCSPCDGQRPSVTVSIYVRHRFDDLTPTRVSAAVYQIKQSLTALGIRER